MTEYIVIAVIVLSVVATVVGIKNRQSASKRKNSGEDDHISLDDMIEIDEMWDDDEDEE